MEIICNPAGIVDLRYPRQGILDMTGAGFENILLSMAIACPAYELEEAGETPQKSIGTGVTPPGSAKENAKQREQKVSEDPSGLHECMRPFAERYMEGKLRISIVRAPYTVVNTKRRNLEGLLAELTLESIRFCGEIGCHHLIVKPLPAGTGTGMEWEVNRKYYLRFVEEARKNRVRLLLENQYQDKNGHPVRGVCSDPGETAIWLEELNRAAGEELFGFCMDTGICSLCGQNMHEFAVSLGDHIKAVILRECNGHTSAAMLPFTCVENGQSPTDWLGLIRGLRQIGFDGQLILDLGHTAISFSPLLRPQVVRLAKSVAEYFRWQIGIENALKKYPAIALFGAGNMCRNYMKCYGEKYPPLFTCDNNSALWGTEFCGLEVRDPEALKDLPKDCGIFICNVYYREIEAQLRAMGLGNIEYFNDEYMPSFYFDRLEREE